MKRKILEFILEAEENNMDTALITLIENKGSAPGEDNSLMAIRSDGEMIGTIGGGKIEADLIRRSKEALKTGENFEFDYNLSKKGELKMSCGGSSRGFVKIFKSSNRLIIFGAGHISQKLARIATLTNFKVDVVDDRGEFKQSEDFVNIENYYHMDSKDALNKLLFDKDKTYIVLATRGHSHDQKVLTEILNKEFKYLGMIGSKAKVIEIFKNLKEMGFDDKKLDKIYTPIGLDIDNGSVEEIAISILSEILMIKNRKDGSLQKLNR